MYPRKSPAPYSPHPEIQRLRDDGWTMGQIAQAVHASERQVFRWYAGDFRPLPVFDAALRSLTGPPPSEASVAA
jgi:hypothetical protein